MCEHYGDEIYVREHLWWQRTLDFRVSTWILYNQYYSIYIYHDCIYLVLSYAKRKEVHGHVYRFELVGGSATMFFYDTNTIDMGQQHLDLSINHLQPTFTSNLSTCDDERAADRILQPWQWEVVWSIWIFVVMVTVQNKARDWKIRSMRYLLDRFGTVFPERIYDTVVDGEQLACTQQVTYCLCIVQHTSI